VSLYGRVQQEVLGSTLVVAPWASTSYEFPAKPGFCFPQARQWGTRSCSCSLPR
jgi:hypothetical protein